VYKSQGNGHSRFGEWVSTLDDKKVNVLAQEAAKGLERVGPKPVSTEEIRPDDRRDEERERFLEKLGASR
jgi:hypothetical protein